MAAVLSTSRFGTPDQIDVLVALEPLVKAEIDRHRGGRTLWFPNDLTNADAEMSAENEAELARTREAARGLPDTVRVALALNLLTEEGLPHFHRLIAVHLGNDSPWRQWNNLWTAEEDRHGCAMRDYVRDARIFSMDALERLQFNYVEAGFEPDWEQDPYRLLAYTSLQEKATQVSHSNTGRLCGAYEPHIQRVLAHISADESRHYAFYRACFGGILQHDPNRALQSLLKVVTGFAMPGHSIPGFDDMSEVLRRANIFGTRQYQKIVEELLAFWNIGVMSGLSDLGRQTQEKLMKMPARLAKLADYADSKTVQKTFGFDFLYGRTVTL